MKLQKIFVVLLSLLLACAAIMSIVAIGDISKKISKDGKTDGTSSGTSSGSTDKTEEPEGSEDDINYLQGNIVKTDEDYTGSLSNYYKLNSGRAFVQESNGVIYCYVKFVIPSAMKSLYLNYYSLDFGDNISTVYRYSYDQTTWYLLNEKRYDYSTTSGWNGASVPKNNSEYIYVSFYTLSASKYTLEEALAEFESYVSESCNFNIVNVMG